MNIKPLFDNILVEEIKKSNTTESGLVLPDTENESIIQGKVISVGDGKSREKKVVEYFNGMSVASDDVVVFEKRRANKIKVDDKEFLIISEKEILAIIK